MTRYLLAVFSLACLVVGCSKPTDSSSSASSPPGASAAATPPTEFKADTQPTTLPSGLQIIEIKIGTGAVAKSGDSVAVHYTGRLADGHIFDSSLPRGEPFSFRLGTGQVIPGWDEGIAGMKVGGKRRLIIPPNLGYGDQGTPGGPIPPNATLHFDVELMSVTP